MLEPDEYAFWWRCEVSGECLLWAGAKNKKGYGFATYRRKTQGAHRIALQYAGVSLLPEQHVLHSCDTPSCCNPNHLRAGSNKDNVNDMLSRDRQSHGERHGRAKLTAAQVAEIRASPMGYKRLAKLYGVKWRAIQKIKTGQRWKTLVPSTA